jgi:hypothetical protein
MDSEKYIGLDVHQATISVAVSGCSGEFAMGQYFRAAAYSRCCLGRAFFKDAAK